MTVDTAFQIATLGVMVCWALLMIGPDWPVTWRLVHTPVVPLAFAMAYLIYAVPGFLAPGAEGGFNSLDQLMLLFLNKQAVMAGWLHYLVMDLFAGAWQARDARRWGLPHWQLVLSLALTLVLGPVGLGFYLALRAVRIRRWPLNETR